MTLQGAIQQLHDIRCDDNFPFYYKPAIDKVIETILTDAQEVRRGRWEDRWFCSNYSGYDYGMNCSVCGKPTHRQLAEKMPPYCPNCGAKMEGEQNG